MPDDQTVNRSINSAVDRMFSDPGITLLFSEASQMLPFHLIFVVADFQSKITCDNYRIPLINPIIVIHFFAPHQNTIAKELKGDTGALYVEKYMFLERAYC